MLGGWNTHVTLLNSHGDGSCTLPTCSYSTAHFRDLAAIAFPPDSDIDGLVRQFGSAAARALQAQGSDACDSVVAVAQIPVWWLRSQNPTIYIPP